MRGILGTIIVVSLLSGCMEPPRSQLERVRERGELVVVTREGPTTYYDGPKGKMGLEYELAERFAQHLGVKLKLVVADRFNRILPMVEHDEADLAAAGLTITEARKRKVRFGPVYQEITPQLVYRLGTPRPSGLSDLSGMLEVVAGSSHEERLRAAALDNPNLHWKSNRKLESGELLHLVSEQLIDYTVADSNEVAVNQRYYPELRVAFDLAKPQPLAWAFPRGADNSLYDEATAFFKQMEDSGDLEQLLERYYGHVEDFDYVGTRLYLRHIHQRLPEFRDAFQQAAKATHTDWRMLAAIGYQESHWNPHARSPTGVRGIMMLTLDTAGQLDVDDRLDPDQSILGGARYFRLVKEKIPDRIPEPDRTWLALAAYNVGFGHLEDARKLTQKLGGDPDKWVDVKKTLPLLSQKKYYSQTQFGYARGQEPVTYVENIRSYYDLLVWTDEQDKRHSIQPPADFITLDSPIL